MKENLGNAKLDIKKGESVSAELAMWKEESMSAELEEVGRVVLVK